MTEALWLGGTVLLRIILILVGSRIAMGVVQMLINKTMNQKRFLVRIPESRRETLTTLVSNLMRYLIYFVAGLMILDQLGVNTSSIIATAGLGGLAIGFGAQSLVRDLVSGFFILLEDHYDVGDFVTISGVSGTVEEVGIRVTRIRDFGGELHIVPNGQIQQVTNHMGQAMRVLVDVDIAYHVDVEQAIQVLEELFAQLSEEMEDIVEGPTVLGVQELGGSGVKLLTWAKAKTMTQWAVTRALRKRIKQAFDAHGIEIPFPRRHLVFDPSFAEALQEASAEQEGQPRQQH